MAARIAKADVRPPDRDISLEPGDRLEVDPRTEHAATVGDDGVLCLEAAAG
ncbi:MAG TPA: hypothetical protein VGR11_05700 [Solirubrobacteraceae bacterium]|nr:hypothetical protein [Solirubrobacteraceae bacterium]